MKTSETDGVITEYAYDAAGRLVKEGDKVYRYGYLDKVLSVNENGAETGRFDYYVDGQLAMATHDGKKENFVWDGLALIKRGASTYVNEPYVTGGNPILSNDKVLFNDMLGTTLGVKDGDNFNAITRDAFGETADRSHDNFFTGKPLVGELGYAFLFRNYRPEQGKWQTADPLGYPDGWNNFAYVNNGVTMAIDFSGGYEIEWEGTWTQSEKNRVVDYAKARCEKEKPFEERSFPSRALPFPNLFEPP